MSKHSRIVPGLIGVLLATAACSGEATPADRAPQQSGSGLSHVLLLGDSVAAGEAVPLTQALAASNVRFQSLAADGGGNVVGPAAEEQWRKLPGRIAAAAPSVVVYQVTTFDWGSAQEQRAAYRRLVDTVAEAGAKLLFVTAPPIRPDDFYRPHLADLARTSGVAAEVAKASAGRAAVADAGEVWGDTYQQQRNGKPDRSSDGIHTCPQGAARFTNWLLGKLAAMFTGFTPADPATWANTGWSDDRRFVGC
jgi:hypothetical protein